MGRPRVSDEERVATAVRFPASLHARLADAAEDSELSVNALVNRAVVVYLERLPVIRAALDEADRTAVDAAGPR
jgi:hypothetical protein